MMIALATAPMHAPACSTGNTISFVEKLVLTGLEAQTHSEGSVEAKSNTTDLAPAPMPDMSGVPKGVRPGLAWLYKNDHKPEKDDPYWAMARKQIAPIYDSGSWKNGSPLRLFGGDPKVKKIALTFDDGPAAGYTKRLLEALSSLNVKATFFVVGKMVRKNPDSLKAIVAAGHEIANHSFSHPTLSKLTPDEVLAEYQACTLIIKDTTGKTPRFCRPPGGRHTRDTYRMASSLGLETALWTCDPLDYAMIGQELLLHRLTVGLKPGAVMLLHNGAKDTLLVLRRFVEYARSKGYQFVTMSEMFPPMATKVAVKTNHK
ncbi:MAG: polysaccharide deacetylase family protein [Armatimonadetes bacterium]|nr:polysaccharide deacetylase family protein [Armatimonadota bacterium]